MSKIKKNMLIQNYKGKLIIIKNNENILNLIFNARSEEIAKLTKEYRKFLDSPRANINKDFQDFIDSLENFTRRN